MELVFLALLVVLMIVALGSGYPVAFALPGAAIISIVAAAASGYFAVGDPSAYFAQGGPIEWLSAGVTNFRGVYWEPERDTLIAIPLFIFMGIMLQRSKIAEDLLVTMAQLFGPVPGGLGISVVFVGALLAATTGIVGATVVAMGLISLPAMLGRKYSPSLACGTICASGTLGQIIPPSIVLIILADQLASAVDQAGKSREALYKAATGEFQMPSEFGVVSTSAGNMFLGAFLPGLVLVALYMIYILIYALLRPSVAPAVGREGAMGWEFAGKVFITLVPPLTLIFLVLGSIITGVATVNQAGAIGAAGATLMAGYRLVEGRWSFVPAIIALLSCVALYIILGDYDTNVKRVMAEHGALTFSTDPANPFYGLSLAAIASGSLILAILWSGWRTLRIENTLRGVMIETAKTTSLVFIILLGAAMLTSAFRAFGGEELVKHFLEGLPGGFWTQFVIVMAVIFVLGFFLDFIEIAVVVVPIVAPILLADPQANITAVWLGVMIGLNIQTSFLTPPFGFALFYLRGVAPSSVKTTQIYKGVIPFILLQLLALGIVGVTPWLVNYLPNRLTLTADTAPPPRNPKLQYCMQEFTAERFASDGAQIRAAIERAQSLDLSALPERTQTQLSASFDKAAEAFPAVEAIKVAHAEVVAASDAYRPIHSQVRRLERDILRLDDELGELRTALRRAGDTGTGGIEARIAHLDQERAVLADQIPDSWEGVHENFAKLTAAEANARKSFTRIVDQAYRPIPGARALLADTASLEAARGELDDLKTNLLKLGTENAPGRIAEVLAIFNGIDGTDDVRAALRDAAAGYEGRLNVRRAFQGVNTALATLDADLDNRRKATEMLGPELAAYDEAIRDTIGLRQQERLPREQALYVAQCTSGHRDVSLSF